MQKLAAMLLACLLLLPAAALAQRSPFAEGQRRDELQRLIPLAEYRDDPALLLYDASTMPEAYQFSMGRGRELHFHAVAYNISADHRERFGNANRDFPWDDPGGTHTTPDVRSFKFIKLPDRQPIVWYKGPVRDSFRGGYQIAWKWMWPIGGVVGEVMLLRTPAGRHVPFEMRLREREPDDWAVDVVVPFPTPGHLAEAIKAADAEWRNEPQLVALVEHLGAGAPAPTRRLVDRTHPRGAFDATARWDVLPGLPAELVEPLLSDFEWTSGLATDWRPTTQSRSHVIPANYHGAFTGADRETCHNCHRDVLVQARHFDAGRDWYGYVRGSDEIFSFSPVHPSSVSTNGSDWPVRMWDMPGSIERYDPARHTNYQELKRGANEPPQRQAVYQPQRMSGGAECFT